MFIKLIGWIFTDTSDYHRSKALFYLYTGMTGNLLKDLVDFTDGQRQKYAEVVQEKFTSSGAMTLMIVGLGGEENFKKLLEKNQITENEFKTIAIASSFGRTPEIAK